MPWDLTGTSSTADVPRAAVTHRVDRRLLVKQERIIVRAGASYLSRGDLRTNPGASLDIAWYPLEILAAEISASAYASSLNQTATALRKSTGLLPDSQKPLARVGLGGRVSFAYGKLLVESLDTVVHVDANAFLHAGVMITDEAVNFASDLGLGMHVGFGRGQGDLLDRLLVWFEAGWIIGYENRSASKVASGPTATGGIGVILF